MDILDAPVRLVVKAPNQRVGDQTIECALSWTVRKLKAYLSEVYPSKPKSEEQKLIYSGQLLHDHLTLKDVLRQYDQTNTHILHLVCSSTKDDVAPTKESSNINTNQTTNSNEGVRQRRSESQPNAAATVSANIPTALPNTSLNPAIAYNGIQGLMLTPEQMSQQMLWMQQMYTQYMTYYLQYAQQSQTGPVFQPTISQPITTPQNAQIPPPQNAPPPRPANENVRMNAQGGQVDDDDDEFGPNRDWLDWFYISSRAFVLLSIVFFYSSLSRFVAVALLVVLFYLYQTDWFQLRQRQRQVPPPEQPVVVEENVRNDDNNNRPQQAAATPVINEEQVNEMQEMENLMDNDLDNPMPQIEVSPSIFSVTWTFISGFFASLIPEQPPQIN